MAGATGLVVGDAGAPAGGGAGEEPDAASFGLSGDWGALDSSAMDPGTLGASCIGLPHATRGSKSSPVNATEEPFGKRKERSASF